MSQYKTRALYFECHEGISADRIIAALLDLGADFSRLKRTMDSFPVQGFDMDFEVKKSSGVPYRVFQVKFQDRQDRQDKQGRYEDTECGEIEIEGNIAAVSKVIDHISMSQEEKAMAHTFAHTIFRAQADLLGISEDEVVFEENMIKESLFYMICAAVCFCDLGIKNCIIPSITEGQGIIRFGERMLSAPTPIVLKIFEDHKCKVNLTQKKEALVTTTGAGIAAAVFTSDELPHDFRIVKIGISGNQKEKAELLRILLIETQYDQEEKDVVYKLESNIDDCTGEAMGYVMGRLMNAGARDVHFIPAFMKKNRPAYVLNVICKKKDIPQLEDIIFEETTTIGIRRQRMERTILKRREDKVSTIYGDVKVKVCQLHSGERKYPEYASVIELCEKTGRSYQEIYKQVEIECQIKGSE